MENTPQRIDVATRRLLDCIELDGQFFSIFLSWKNTTYILKRAGYGYRFVVFRRWIGDKGYGDQFDNAMFSALQLAGLGQEFASQVFLKSFTMVLRHDND